MATKHEFSITTICEMHAASITAAIILKPEVRIAIRSAVGGEAERKHIGPTAATAPLCRNQATWESVTVNSVAPLSPTPLP
jgi:hypothetical protein